MSNKGFVTGRRGALGIVAATAMLPLLPARGVAAPGVPDSTSKTSRDIDFNEGWLFQRGQGSGLEVSGLDDKGWRAVDLPHDWSIEDIPGKGTPFDKDAIGEGSTGYTVGGEGWYRKHFRLDKVAADARVEIAFDGIYELSDVWLNGVRIGGSVSGYSPFALDLTPHLDRDGDNVLAVRVRNEGKNSRWYAGSGIYREVRLDIIPAGTSIPRWGVGAWTRRITDGAAEVEVTSKVSNPAAATELVTRLRDAAGRVVGEAKSASATDVRQLLSVRGARLWSPADPYLHILETELRRGGKVLDRIVQPFGLRIVAFDPQRGMTINGETIKIRGGCVHHDNGLLGARAFREADERRVRLLQARGYNAIRSAHNIASRSLREACDRLGMLLIDEAFDMWHFGKNPDDFSTRFKDHWSEVLQAMVLPARNSPSVMMWSIGNEIPRRTTPEGIEWSWKLANAVRRLDPTRPVTAAIHGTLGPTLIPSEASARPGRAGKVDNASIVFLDVPGYNYRLEEIEFEHQAHPERVVYASETFARDVVDYHRLMKANPCFIGEFLWMAMDYIGEAALGRSEPIKPGTSPYARATWPYTNGNCGDLDLTGAQKPPSLARDVVWGLSLLEVLVRRPIPEGMVEHVTNWGWPDELPSWTWPGQEGKPLSVRAFTVGDRIDVLLNGTKVAGKAISVADKMRALVEVPYTPGELEVVAYSGDQVIARRPLRTTGSAARLGLVPERSEIKASRQGLAFVRLSVMDASGKVLPDDGRAVRLAVRGPAELVAFGSGNPRWTGSLQASATRTFRGEALAILRSTGKQGTVHITAETDGLPSASTTVRAA